MQVWEFVGLIALTLPIQERADLTGFIQSNGRRRTTLSYDYTMRFIGYDSIQTSWFISYPFQIRTITLNQGDKSHLVIVALVSARHLTQLMWSSRKIKEAPRFSFDTPYSGACGSHRLHSKQWQTKNYVKLRLYDAIYRLRFYSN